MNFLSRSLLVSTLVALPVFPALAESKRVLVCTVTTGFRHGPSIAWAEKTLQKLADESHGTFVVAGFVQQPPIKVQDAPHKPKDLAADADDAAKKKYADEMKKYLAAVEKWTPQVEAAEKAKQVELEAGIKKSLERLSPANLAAEKIDGVIFANTTGDLPLPDPEGFIKWVEAGHAFMGMHSASDTFHHFRPYIEMLGGEFQAHQAQVPADLVAGDASHPANGGIGAAWNLGQEEMYHIKNQDRSNVHVLWFMRHDPNDTAKDVFFPVSWCRKAGSGKVFYTSLGHREDLWSDSADIKDRKNSAEISHQYQAHILGGIHWALGLAEGDAKPNPEVK